MDFPVPVGEVILGTSVSSGPVRPCAPPRCVREGCVWMTTETTRLSVSVTADTGSMRPSVSWSTTAPLVPVIMVASVFLSMVATSVLVSLVTEDQHVSLTSMSVPVILV